MNLLVKTIGSAGCKSTPTYAINNSKIIKTAFFFEEKSIYGCKKVKGRNRHIVDIMDNLLIIVIHTANIHDTKSCINPAKRWIVERIFVWSDNSKRLAKDFERNISYAQGIFFIFHLHNLLKRY